MLVTLCMETCSSFCPLGLKNCFISPWLGALTSSQSTWQFAGEERLRKGLLFLQCSEKCLDNVTEIASPLSFPGPFPNASPVASMDTSAVSSDFQECPVLRLHQQARKTSVGEREEDVLIRGRKISHAYISRRLLTVVGKITPNRNLQCAGALYLETEFRALLWQL